jgi:Na+/H+ antiporter NhaD/arsenite permease-like protein
VMMVLARTGAREVFTRVDWTLLAFFGGLFVVVAGVAHAGVLQKVFDAVAPIVARGDTAGDLAFIALVVVGSNLVSNVPLVLVAVAWIPHMPEPTWGYIMLALASTLAGTLTLFGSVAKILVMETAGPRGEISFWRFLRFGSVITIANLALAFAILGAERALGIPAMLGL